MLRPSLSVGEIVGVVRTASRVAGAYAPAFVERARRWATALLRPSVSPELMLRPSLSDAVRPGIRGGAAVVSPELMFRPSLSARQPGLARLRSLGVAGAYAPAFVERTILAMAAACWLRRVAGAYAPAFVERPGPTCAR